MDRQLRIGMVLASTSASGGGVPQAVRSLSQALAARPAIEVEVFSLHHDDTSGIDFGSVPLHVLDIAGPRSFSYAPDLAALLDRRDLDCLHVHGLWMYTSVATRRWARRTGRPYVVSPHGMLDAWAMRNSGLKKRAARLIYEDGHLNGATFIHALCEAERSAIRDLRLRAPICLVPNGVDAMSAAGEVPDWRQKLTPDHKVLLFLGRITPKKHVAELLLAWHAVRQAEGAENWQLVLVGPTEPEYLAQLQDIIATHQLADTVTLAGPAYGDARGASYRAADAFILPSISEGLPMSALEALSCGLPSLLTPQCNLPEAFNSGALQIGADVEAIATGLRALFAMTPQHRHAVGVEGRALVARQFDWAASAKLLDDVYRAASLNGAVTAS